MADGEGLPSPTMHSDGPPRRMNPAVSMPPWLSEALCAAAWTRLVLMVAAVLAATITAPVARAQSAAADRIVRINEGIQHFHRGDHSRAVEVFSELVAGRPEDTASQYYLALARMQLAVGAAEQAERVRLFKQAGDGLSRALAEDPALIDAHLDLGIARLGQPSREADAAESIRHYIESPQGESDGYGHFFYAVALYRMGRYDDALVVLDRTETLDEMLTPYTTFYRGLVLTRIRRPEEAREVFAEVPDLAPGTALAQRAESLAQQVEEPAGGAFGATVRIGSAFDSNVVLLGDDTALPRDLSSKEDWRFGIETDLSYAYSVPPEALAAGESLTVGIGGLTYSSWHAAVEEFDVQTYGGRAFVNYEPITDLFVGVQYDYDYNLVGNEPFLSRNRVTPLIKIIEWRDRADDAPADPRTWTTVFYSYETRDYFEPMTDERLDRDGSYHIVGVVQDINLLRPWEDDERWLAARVGYRFHRASTQGEDFDANVQTITGGFDVPLPWGLTFDVSGEWSWEDYTRPSTIDFGRSARQDFVHRYLFGLTKQINRHLAVRAVGNLILDDSIVLDRFNQAPFSYDRANYGISVIYAH